MKRLIHETVTVGPEPVAPDPEEGDWPSSELQGPRIGPAARIGPNATVRGGVTIGKEVVVRAGAVVSEDVPSYTLAAGVSARVVKDILPEAVPVSSGLPIPVEGR